jgi:hypothetical protein
MQIYFCNFLFPTFLLAFISCTKGFHCDISLHTLIKFTSRCRGLTGLFTWIDLPSHLPRFGQRITALRVSVTSLATTWTITCPSSLQAANCVYSNLWSGNSDPSQPFSQKMPSSPFHSLSSLRTSLRMFCGLSLREELGVVWTLDLVSSWVRGFELGAWGRILHLPKPHQSVNIQSGSLTWAFPVPTWCTLP